MRAKIGLAAYRTLSRRGSASDPAADRGRPKGELIWLHAAETGSGRAIGDLARRLATTRIGLNLLLTSAQPETAAQFGPLPESVHVLDAPSDHPALAESFVDHWSPDATIWAWGGFRPNTILALARRQVPMILIDAGREGFESRRDRWLPEVPRTLLGHFDHVIARSEAAQTRLVQLGRSLGRIERAPPLRPIGTALPVRQTDLDDLSDALAGRSVWLAAHTAADEVATVIAAHRRAMRQSHRLLLVLHLDDPADAEACANACATEGLRCVRWSDGDMPEELTQVLIADTPGELGLWYRLAPVSFLGQSLNSGAGGIDPFDAAALGTAVLYGPHVAAHLPSFSRLAAAGAARIVNDAHALGGALAQLIAPDQAANMAMSGWNVTTEGASVIDRVSELAFATLDARSEEQG